MRGDGLRIGAALLAGAALAFPAALWLTPPAPAVPPPAAGGDPTGMRNMWSPVLLHDPHFLAEQRKGVEALERRCAEAHAFCAEARKARAALDRLAQ